MNETQTLPNAGPLFLTTLDQLTDLVHTVSTGDLDLATPCDGWSVRDLLSHLVAVQDRIPHIAGGGKPSDTPSQVQGIPDEGWLSAWDDRLPRLRAAIENDEDRGRIVVHPAGPMPWAVAVGIYASEIAVHSWDLARALGRDSDLNQQVALGVLPPIKGALPAEPRGAALGIPFGPVVPVADDATPYAQLVGWLGRDPEWTAA